jgi:arylsulfatase A-like enzyme
MKPNFLVILIDDLRYDEFGAGGHPYMQTPHIDRLAHEGANFERAFHTTPICSPNRASIVSGQYASRHGIIDNVARDAMSHRLPNYHLELRGLGYETAHIGKWHMGNDGMPRPGYDTWISYDGHGKLNDPRLNHNGKYVQHSRRGLTPVRQRRIRCLSRMRHSCPRVSAAALCRVRPREAGGLFLQAARVLPLVRGAAHGGNRCLSGR